MMAPRRVLVGTVGAVPQLAQFVPRLLRLLDTAETILARLATLIDDVEATNVRAREVAERSAATEAVAARAADQAAAIAARADDLVDRYEPALQKMQPVVRETATRISDIDPDEVASLIETLPGLVRTAQQELVPVLQTLRTVAPDLSELLEVSRTLNEMLGTVPGLGRVKKRIDEEE